MGEMRDDAQELFVQAAARLETADASEFFGPQRLCDRLDSDLDTDEAREALREVGADMTARAQEYLRSIGEDALLEDTASVGFIVCAALSLYAAPPHEE